MSEMIYSKMVQVVLLFGAEIKVLLVSMSNNLEGVHVGFHRQVTADMAKCQRDETWKSAAAASVLKEVLTQTRGKYIDKTQATVSEWVVLMPILEVCDRETGYKGGGRRREKW